MPCPFCLLVIQSCEFIHSQAHVAEHSWRKSLRSFKQSHQESHVAIPNLHLVFPCLGLTNPCLMAEGPDSEESQPSQLPASNKCPEKDTVPRSILTPCAAAILNPTCSALDRTFSYFLKNWFPQPCPLSAASSHLPLF